MVMLFESYTSQKELQELTKLILHRIADKTFSLLQSNQDKIYYFEPVFLNEFNPDNFVVLGNFIKDFGDLKITLMEKENFDYIAGGSKASYVRVRKESGDMKRMIVLLEDPYSMERSNDYVKNWDIEKANSSKIIDSISQVLFFNYKDSLIHELQHAYDDFRTKGKFEREGKEFPDKEKYNYLTKKMANIPQEVKDEEYDFIAQQHKIYLNMKHEVDARLATAIQKTNFYEVDLDKSFEAGKMVYRMFPYQQVLNTFKNKLYPYFQLSPEHQRRVLQKFGQFYQLEKEYVDLLNKKEEKL